MHPLLVHVFTQQCSLSGEILLLLIRQSAGAYVKAPLQGVVVDPGQRTVATGVQNASLSAGCAALCQHSLQHDRHTWNHAPHSTTIDGQNGMRVLRLPFLSEDALWGGLGLISLSSSNPHCVVPGHLCVQQLAPWHRCYLAAVPAAAAPSDGSSSL